MPLTSGQIIATLTRQDGLNKTAAAGVAGNAQQESGDNPASAGGHLLQWIGSRGAAYNQYAASHHLDPNSAAASLGYLHQELSTTYKGLGAQLNQTHSPQAAAKLFEQQFERAGIPMMGNRMKYAGQALADYNKNGGGPIGNLNASQGGGVTVKLHNTPAQYKQVTTQLPDWASAGADAFLKAAPNASSTKIGTSAGSLGSLASIAGTSDMPTITQHSTEMVHPSMSSAQIINNNGHAAVANAADGDPGAGSGGLAKVVSLAMRAHQQEQAKGDYDYTEAGGLRTNEGKGVLSPSHNGRISYDCSGFVGALYHYAGLPSPYSVGGYGGTSGDVANNPRMQKVNLQQAQPGDVAVFPGHVAVYIGHGQVISMGEQGEPKIVSLSAEEAYNNRGITGIYHMKGH